MKEDVRVRFGGRIHSLRKKQGWTQAELADRVDLDRSYVADIERGNRNVSLINIESLAGAFGLTLSQLFRNL